MQLPVTGKLLDVGAAPRRRAETDQTASVIKYFDGAKEADIVSSREVPLFSADISLPIGQDLSSKTLLKRIHPYPAFGMTLEHAPKQLRPRDQRDHRMNNLPKQA
jgi:hypothetical protein